MLLLIASLCLAKSTQIDFDEIEVTAERPTPSVTLIQDTVHDLCSVEDNTTLRWQECIANLSYDEISQVCSSLGGRTPEIVNDLLTTTKPETVYQDHSDGQILKWQGCLYNSETGPRVEHYLWIYAKDNWIMTDGEHNVWATDSQSSLTVFDGREVSSNNDDITGNGFTIQGTFAYLLTPSVTTNGRYVGTLARNSQRDLNAVISSLNLRPPYCDGSLVVDDCDILPNMIVTSVTPWMMIVKTIMPDKVGYQVSGIFFQSITGYDYADSEK